MPLNSNGQVSYYVLDSLSQGSKYGLEIIEHISKKTDGAYILKKPTLYSCLTRMEKKGYVSSSFWGESDMGGKRHYYTITPEGRKYLEELSTQANEFEVANQPQTTQQSEKPVFLQQDNLFGYVQKEEVKEKEQTEKVSEVSDNQMDIFSYETEKHNEPIDDTATSLSANQTESVGPENKENQEKMEYYQSILEKAPASKLTYEEEAQNQKLYDTSSELKKFRKRRSFSENQIEMAVVYENEEDEKQRQERIEQLKASMLNARRAQSQTLQSQNETQISKPAEHIQFSQETNEPQERVDDAVLITEPRMRSEDVPIQRRITPPNIDIDVSDSNLPAPRRNTELEPTYKDMMAKLFERKKEKKIEKETHTEENIEVTQVATEATNFVDYSTLKSYYNGHGIEFKEYRHSNIVRNHNTNFLLFICSVVMLLLSGIGCAILFGIISACNGLSESSNFLFYTVPLLFFVYSVFAFVRFKCMPNKKASLRYNAVVNWAIVILSAVVILIINIIAGMQYETMGNFITSLVVPMYAILIVFPINFYMLKFLFTRYAK